jgi:hypothetical protein
LKNVAMLCDALVRQRLLQLRCRNVRAQLSQRHGLPWGFAEKILNVHGV